MSGSASFYKLKSIAGKRRTKKLRLLPQTKPKALSSETYKSEAKFTSLDVHARNAHFANAMVAQHNGAEPKRLSYLVLESEKNVSAFYMCTAIESIGYEGLSTVHLCSRDVEWEPVTHVRGAHHTVIIKSHASLLRALQKNRKSLDGVFLDACGAVPKLLDHIRLSFGSLWEGDALWGLTWSTRHSPVKAELDAASLSMETWAIINGTSVGGPYEPSDEDGASRSWVFRFCAAAACAAGFELQLSYHHQHKQMNTIICRARLLEPILSPADTVRAFWVGDEKRRSVAAALGPHWLDQVVASQRPYVRGSDGLTHSIQCPLQGGVGCGKHPSWNYDAGGKDRLCARCFKE